MERALSETERRRAIQKAYNDAHGITPKSVVKEVRDVLEITSKQDYNTMVDGKRLSRKERMALISRLEKEMKAAAKIMEFEHAAYLRDRIKELMGNEKEEK